MLIVENGTVRKETYDEWRARMDARFEEQVARRERELAAEESQRNARRAPPKKRTTAAKPRPSGHTRTTVRPGQECAGGCGWKLVPRTGKPLPEGHREHMGKGMCNTCLRRTNRGGKPRFKPPAECVNCGIRLVPRTAPRQEGTRKHAGHGLCTTCHTARREGRL